MRVAKKRDVSGSSYSRSPSLDRITAGKAEGMSDFKAKLAEQQARRRSEIEERRKNRRETSLESRKKVGGGFEPGSVKWLENQLFEVELVLRSQISCEEDLHYTLGAAEAGLLFMEQIELKAKQCGCSKGALSRFVLPFDSDTQITEQATFNKVGWSVENSQFAGKITDRDLNYLVQGANSMRRLVRIKVADDNDLETAAAALRTTAEFLRKTVEDAKRRGCEDDIYNTIYKSLRDGKDEDYINEEFPVLNAAAKY